MRSILKKLGTGADTTSSFVPSGAYPRLVLGGLLVFGLATIWLGRARARARRGLGDDGTGAASPAAPSSLGAVPIALVAAGVVLHLFLAERAGFVMAASVLFWCTARAFDHRHPVRDGIAAVAISLSTYVLFARVLQLSLP